MAGIFTDRRDLSRPLPIQLWDDYGNPYRTIPVTLPDVQETTSYRSGRELSDDESIRQDSRIYGSARDLVPRFDTGHEFQTQRRRFLYTSKPDWVGRYNGVTVFRGPLLLQNSPDIDLLSSMPSVQPMTTNDQLKYGQRAISGTAPTAPKAGLSAAAGELRRDGIPAMIGHVFSRGPSIHALGHEYLNVEFGWKPLISDITKLMKSVKKSSQIMHQLQRDSGKYVRRQFSFPVEQSVSEFDLGRDSYQNLLVGMPNVQSVLTSTISCTDAFTTRIWFKGAFSYYIPSDNSLMSRFRRYEELANKVLGTRLTPSVLYQLAPWSWLLDWFADLGSAIKATDILSSDSLVIRWGYLMRQTDVFRTLRFDVRFPLWDGAPETTVVNASRVVRKERWRASPYGFAVNSDQFSDQQWAILAALGMTKSPRVAF